MNFEIVKPEINNEDLINLLSMNFPEIKDELYDSFNYGIIHLQMAVLSRYTNKHIENKQFDKTKKIIDLLLSVINKVDSETENAIYVSFIENLYFGEMEEKLIEEKLNPRFFKIWKKLNSSDNH
jgi:hypothetical protein